MLLFKIKKKKQQNTPISASPVFTGNVKCKKSGPSAGYTDS